MRAKFKVTGVTPSEYDGKKQNEVVKFIAVGPSGSYPDDGSDENNSYAKWSPSADLSITIANPNLWDRFKVGQEFYADFTLAKDVEPSFKTYRSHKIVDAAKIESYGYDGVTPETGGLVWVNLVGGERLNIPANLRGRLGDALQSDPSKYISHGNTGAVTLNLDFEPGYLVKYQDGYLSYSPKKAFEEGYTETTEVFDSTGKSIGIKGVSGMVGPVGVSGVRTED